MTQGLNSNNLEGRTAIITGAASGIGREIAFGMANAGAKVVVADLSKTRNEVVEIIFADGGRAIGVELDVTDELSIKNMISLTKNEFGKIDILVNSAGIGVEKPFLETSKEDWDKIINVDLTGTFLCCREAAKSMEFNGWGRIITLASTAGVRGGYNRGAYGAAKGGVIALTKVMAVELAKLGITVNAIAPGAIETDMVRKMHTDETRKIYTDLIPQDRYGTPTEVAAVALFLASDQASYINGHVLAVDGGFLGAGLMKRDV